MEQSKIVQYISKMERKDQDKFTQFVESPYFNQHEATREMLHLILKETKRKKPRLGKEYVFGKLFPGEPFDEQKLYNLMSNLKKLLHRFLAQQEYEEQPFQEDLHTVNWAYAKNQFDLFTNRAKNLHKKLEKIPYRNEDYYYTKYRLQFMLGYYGGQYVDRSKSDRLQRMMDHLDKYYILEKLRNSCHLTAHEFLMNTTYNFSLLDQVIGYVEENLPEYKDDSSIMLYYYVLLTLRHDSSEYYQELKKIMQGGYDRLSPLEQQDLYSFSQNYCIRKINQGQYAYQLELFQLYKQGLTSGILLTNGVINEWDYKNITTLACGLKEFAWTENFINKYKNHIPAHQRENAYNYNLANLYYNKKLYDKAIETLNQVQYTDIKYHLNGNDLLLRTFYAKKDIEAVLSLIDTFRLFIFRNKKITTVQKKGYTTFLRFTKRLVLLKNSKSTFTRKEYQQRMEKLHGQISENKEVINKKWLIRETGLDQGQEQQAMY